jgi:S-adenosylmethionine synthetase
VCSSDLVEDISIALSKEYLKYEGVIMHHNVDKMLLAAGEAEVDFGGGKLTKKIDLILGGRAIAKTPNHTYDVTGIGIDTAKKHMLKNVRNLDWEAHVNIESRIGRGSADLVDVFKRKGKKSSGDTSFGTGFAPFSVLENTVLAIEHSLNSDAFKKKVPACGEDIKVMGLRQGGDIKITVACAMVSKYLSGLPAYAEAKHKIWEEAVRITEKIEKKGDEEVHVAVNTADDEKAGSVYITVTGTSAENGGDGSVGRGNRVNGLITPFRPMSLEAAAGKNPVTHVGKIYNVAAQRLAEELVAKFPDLGNVDVVLLSQIGKPIDQPKEASIKVSADESDYQRIKSDVRAYTDAFLERVGQGEIAKMMIEKKVTVY